MTASPTQISIADGYRGIWFTLGYSFAYGDKYSGGLGTYTSSHAPMAEYAPAVRKTFFTWGGTPSEDKRQLAIMVSFYDHERDRVPRPVMLYLDPAVDDPHDNASLRLDARGHVWVFKSGRNTSRPGAIFRGLRPYDISAFERLPDQEFTYPQVWDHRDGGWLLLFTKYFSGSRLGPERKLFWKTSAAAGRDWSGDRLLAGFGGHYQTSGQDAASGKIATFFNWHPDSDNDRRTNVYYAQTVDFGRTWTTVDGRPLELPLAVPDNSALVRDYAAQGRFVYTCDLAFDRHGHPVLLCIVSRAGEPGPAGDPREWTILRWTGGAWEIRVVAVSDHNYDMGSLYIDGAVWRVTGPTAIGPQKWGAGGEIETWISRDEGRTWTRERALTAHSERNHSYVRRPHRYHPDFAAFWADGDPTRMTRSLLYFANADGTRVRCLPYEMEGEWACPADVAPPVVAEGEVR